MILPDVIKWVCLKFPALTALACHLLLYRQLQLACDGTLKACAVRLNMSGPGTPSPSRREPSYLLLCAPGLHRPCCRLPSCLHVRDDPANREGGSGDKSVRGAAAFEAVPPAAGVQAPQALPTFVLHVLAKLLCCQPQGK